MARTRGQAVLCTAKAGRLKWQQEPVEVKRPKYKAGQARAQQQVTPQKIQEIRDLAAQWGRIVARRAFGDAGLRGPVCFQTLAQTASCSASTDRDRQGRRPGRGRAMSTRALYTFRGQDSQHAVCKHYDGYPTEALAFIANALQRT
jgi:hypothetical protein